MYAGTVSLFVLGACTSSDSVEVVRPAAGEVITAGTQVPVEWVGGDSDTVDIVLSLPDGSEERVASGVANTGTFDWTVPLYDPPGSGQVRLSVQPVGTNPNPVAPPITMGSLVGFRWNGAEEEYYWVDAVTGASTVLGTVGDMKWWAWKGGAAFDAVSGTVYVVASPDMAGTQKLYALDGTTGALRSDVVLDGPHPAAIQVNRMGEVLGFRWNEMEEELVVIDPATGTQVVRGIVGDMTAWSLEAAIDNVNDRLYVLASRGKTWSVYTLDSLTGALLDKQPLSYGDIGGLVTTSTGALVGFRWNETTEDVLSIDPTTGAVSVIGTVGDLSGWWGYASLNPSTDEIYVFGADVSDQTKLYTVDANTGAEGEDPAFVNVLDETPSHDEVGSERLLQEGRRRDHARARAIVRVKRSHPPNAHGLERRAAPFDVDP